MNQGNCPLSPALLELLQAMVDHHTRETGALAEALNVSSHTVRTYFQRIFRTLGVHSRAEALLFAITHEWVALEPQLSKTPPAREDPRNRV
ncbi:MAG TPA: LuxR C-terminal-related transcriptional regulator [Armatimonadota bacterium]|nr:LuxR C-terminal-related transcriptional regulator [Armatimonadota bacterium]